jgi:phosphoribosyl-ATP pyrophosphohydrolase
MTIKIVSKSLHRPLSLNERALLCWALQVGVPNAPEHPKPRPICQATQLVDALVALGLLDVKRDGTGAFSYHINNAGCVAVTGVSLSELPHVSFTPDDQRAMVTGNVAPVQSSTCLSECPGAITGPVSFEGTPVAVPKLADVMAKLADVAEEFAKLDRDTQLRKVVEECGELIVAISHHRDGKVSREAVVTEACDVLIVAMEALIIYGGDDRLVALNRVLTQCIAKFESK